MDLIKQLPVSTAGKDAIVVFVDKLSKMVRLAATTTTVNAEGFAHLFIDNVFRSHGFPKKIVSDRDARFTGNFLTEVTKQLKIQQAFSTSFHPQTDGQTERMNRTLEDMLRHYVNPYQNDWDEYLKAEKMVVTPLIKRLGVCVVLDMPGDDPSSDPDATKKTLGCLITNMDPGVNGLFNPVNCTYRALIGANMETTEIFFYKLLRHALVPVGEVLYMDMSVIEDDRFRAQGGSNAGKFLYTRLSVPNVRIPEEGKLYVAALYQPVNNRGRRENYSSSITFAVNPWDVQLVSEYAGEPRNIVKNLK